MTVQESVLPLSLIKVALVAMVPSESRFIAGGRFSAQSSKLDRGGGGGSLELVSTAFFTLAWAWGVLGLLVEPRGFLL
jgi:hypothetical protein